MTTVIRRIEDHTGVVYRLKMGHSEFEVDNRWVVPHNHWLLLKYDCHINLEYCASITSVKYIFKYVYKGHDCSNIESKTRTFQQLEAEDEQRLEWDEISSFLNTRYVSAPEAAWRIFKFPLSDRSHVITRLAVRLPLEQPVFFQPGNKERAVIGAATKETTLTDWFKFSVSAPPHRRFHSNWSRSGSCQKLDFEFKTSFVSTIKPWKLLICQFLIFSLFVG